GAGGCRGLRRSGAGLRGNAGLERQHRRRQIARRVAGQRAQIHSASAGRGWRADRHHFDRSRSRRNHRAAPPLRIALVESALTMAEPLKAGYSSEYLERLASSIARHHPGKFNRRQFLQSVFDADWEQRELKARLQHIRSCLHQHVRLSYVDALSVLMAAAPEFGGYHAILFPDYVEAYGLDDWQPSMRALAHFTKYSSAEFAVRPFLVKDPERMLKQMQRWSRDDNEHLRRLSSEGARPRLPWAMALPQFKRDPAPLLPILDQLHADPSLYVRKSVANHLNDIAKDNPQVTLDWARRFRGVHAHTDWIIKRACRTLLKRADADALA